MSWLNDAETMKYSDQKFKQHTLSTCRIYWKSFEGSPNEFWAIILAEGEKIHIGNITTYADPIHDVVDISILIGEKSRQGKGYGLEAWKGMCHFLLCERKVRKITGGTLSINDKMIAVMKKSGMVEDGRRIRHCICDGKEVDLIHAALFRSLDKNG